MKKIYLSALSLAVVTGVSAQIGTTQLAPKNSTFESNKVNAPYATSFEKVDLWSNDVSVAADWAFTNVSSPSQDWYIETDPAAVPSDGPVAMTSAANGFLMIDSDGAGQAGNQDAYAEYVGATAIDCSGQTAVTLEFEQHYRTYLDERYVEVSSDGITWDSYTVTDGTEGGGTVVSGIASIDISATAANQASVSIRFRYVANWGWHWAIDDILVKSSEDYDLKADATVWGVVGSWGPRLPYFTTPSAQIQPIGFCGINTNIGVNDIADATYNVDIASASYSSTGTTNSVAGVTDTICATAVFTPAGAGSFTAVGSMSTAANTDTGTGNNDFADVSFSVNQFLYARDNSDVVVDGGTFNNGDGFESGNIYDIFAAADLHAIRVGINAAAVAGASIYVKLYTIDATTGDFVLQDQSLSYTVLASDLGGHINLPLLSGAYALAAGESYLIVVGSDGDGGLSNDLVVMTSGDSEPQTTFYYNATDLTWYYSTSTPAVEMNFDPNFASIEENGNVFGMGVYPNPTNADANVSFSLNNAADVNITVTDLSGKVVYSNALGNVAAGTSEVALNTASLSNGVYMINVAADNAVSTEKLIIRK